MVCNKYAMIAKYTTIKKPFKHTLFTIKLQACAGKITV